jgi:hypothetical protein
MIVQLEIEQMIKELSKHDSDKARDYINVLNRTLLELRESNERLRQSMKLTSESELNCLNLIIFDKKKLETQLTEKQTENDYLKKNIDLN